MQTYASGSIVFEAFVFGVIASHFDAAPSGVQIVDCPSLGVSVTQNAHSTAVLTPRTSAIAKVMSYDDSYVSAITMALPHGASTVTNASKVQHSPMSELLTR